MTIQAESNDEILRVLSLILIVIRASESLAKAQGLADIFHNVPVRIANGQDPAAIIAEIEMQSKRYDKDDYIARLFENVRAR